MRPLLIDIFHLKNSDSVFIGLILSIIGAILGYFTNLITDNGYAFAAVAAVVGLDFIFGVINAVKNNNFQTGKALKVVEYLFTYWLILAVTLSIELGFQGTQWMSEAIMIPILVFTLVSRKKNASLFGVLPKGLLLKILENIDSYKNAAYISIAEEVIKNEEVINQK